MTRRRLPTVAIPAEIETWRDLVQWLADSNHKGHVYPMARWTRTSAGTVRQWADGIIQVPKLESVLAVSVAYDLPLDRLMAIARPKGPQAPVRDEHGGRIRTKAQAAARREALGALEEREKRGAGISPLLEATQAV
jgi:hypothetical protein